MPKFLDYYKKYIAIVALLPARVSIHMLSRLWENYLSLSKFQQCKKYPFSNFNGATVEVWE